MARLRAPDHLHSFSVSIVVHARPEHWVRRRASLANLRGTQVHPPTRLPSGTRALVVHSALWHGAAWRGSPVSPGDGL
jgi:hypothetical protein